MIESLQVKNYQSLYDVTLDIGKFTVIVGPSSSGKSALVRSLRTLVSNPRNSSFVSHGEKFSTITLKREDCSVVLEKGEGHGAYIVSNSNGEEEKFTKLGGSVPEKVTSSLGIRPVESGKQHLNFASQLDKPYLLDETGSTVARVFGDLTNVTKIFEAVREASRKKQNLSGIVKARTTDVDNLKSQKEKFSSLPLKIESIEEAESLLKEAQSKSDTINRLSTLISDISFAETVLDQFTSSDFEVPDLDSVLAYRDNLSRFMSLVSGVKKSNSSLRDLDTEQEKIESILSIKTDELKNTLHSAGECPTCGQVIR